MEALWSVDDLSSDEEEDASNRDMYDYGRRMFSFVIDIDEAMFDNSGKFMVMALTAMRNVLMKCVRESKTDLVSVVLFNTNDTTSTNFEHVTNFIPLGDLNAEKVLKLEKLVQPQSQPLRDLKRYLCDPSIATTLPRKNVIKNTLWHCQSLRDRVNVKISHHCIVLFTPEDTPKEDFKLVLQQANDMGTNKKSSLTVIGFGDFQYPPFYKEVLLRANNLSSDEWVNPGAFNTVESIINIINTHRNSLRCFRRLNMCLADGLQLKMALYNITRNKYSLCPTSTHVTREDNTRVTVSSVEQTKSTGELVLRNEISYYTKVQGESIHFSAEEKARILAFQSQGIHVLGTVPLSLIKPHYQAGHSAFLVPADSSGFKLGGLLLKTLAQKGLVFLCSVVYGKKGKPRLAALIPHLEDDTYPHGFFLKPLPYADEIRTQVLSIIPSVQPEEAERKCRSAMNLVKTFSKPDFKVGQIREPKSDMEWAAVEALALQRSDMELVRDETLPPGHGMKRLLEMDEA